MRPCCTLTKPCENHITLALGEDMKKILPEDVKPDMALFSVPSTDDIPLWVKNNFDKTDAHEEALISGIQYMARTGTLLYDGKRILFSKSEE